MSSLWQSYDITRFFSFETIKQVFVCDVGSFWESNSGFLLYKSNHSSNIQFLSKEKLLEVGSPSNPNLTYEDLRIFTALQREEAIVIS